MTSIHNVALVLTFIVISILVHIASKNIRQILLISCQLLTSVYITGLLWILVQLHRLPEWQNELADSIWTLVNMTTATIVE